MLYSEELDNSPTKGFSEAIAKRKSEGKDIISLGLGEPDLETPKYIVDATIKAIYDGYTNYCPAQGLPELRELIARQATKDYKMNFEKDEVVVVPGIKSAVYSALSIILQPHDKIAMITPCYVAYPSMIKVAEPTAEIISIDLKRDFTFDVDKILATIDAGIKCLLINSPNNPTGAIINESDMKKIVDKCIEKKVYILSDEVYDKMTFYSYKHISFADFPEIKNLLIIANGYSKSHAMTGWRLGYALAPKEICRKIGKLQFNTNTNTCTFIQKGACSIYTNEQAHIQPYVLELEDRINYFHKHINKLKHIKGIKPNGGFFYFADISSSGLDSNSFAALLVTKTGLATTPGLAFGQSWDNYIRFSLAVPMSVIKKSIALLEQFDRYLGEYHE